MSGSQIPPDSEEVERLRARVSDLETQLAEGQARPSSDVDEARGPVWRSVVAAVLIVVACLLAPLSVASVWASRQLSDTQQYVQTVAPLADDPAVQKAIADQVSTAVLSRIDVQGVTSGLLSTLAAQPNLPPRIAAALPALAVPLTNGVEGFTRTQVGNFVASPQFATVWAEVNRVAHTQVVKLLEGNQGGAVSAQNDSITLNLAPIIAEVKQRLVARGFSLAANVPDVNQTFTLVQSSSISQAQSAYRLLNTLGAWLPLVALVMLAGGVLLAHDPRRALLRGSLGVAVAMVLLGVALAIARIWYVDTTPGNVLTPEAAGTVFDTLVRFLRTAVRAVGVLALLVALGAAISGPSSGALRTRRAFAHGIGSLREGAAAAGLDTGRLGGWLWLHRRALRSTVLVLAGLVLVFWSQPTAWVVVGVAVVALLVMGVLEFLSRPPYAGPPLADSETARPEDTRDIEDTARIPRQVQRRPGTPSAGTETPEETPVPAGTAAERPAGSPGGPGSPTP